MDSGGAGRGEAAPTLSYRRPARPVFRRSLAGASTGGRPGVRPARRAVDFVAQGYLTVNVKAIILN